MSKDEWRRLADYLKRYSRNGAMLPETKDVLYSLSVVFERMAEDDPNFGKEE